MDTSNTYPGLVNHFLIAMPELRDPNFDRTVTLICQHDANGALGVVINRPLDHLTLKDVFDQLDLSTLTSESTAKSPVYYGGPVQQELGLVLHEGVGDWGSTLAIGDNLGLTSSRDVLESLSRSDGPGHSLAGVKDSLNRRCTRTPGSVLKRTVKSSFQCRPNNAGPQPLRKLV